MDVYAQPIPPEIAIQTTSKVNLREALLHRLSEVQLQKQLQVLSPVDYGSAPEPWATERNLLIDMLEKSQKLQASSQASWTKEREELLTKISRVEVTSQRQLAELRFENSRLKEETANFKNMIDELVRLKTLGDKKQESALRGKILSLEKKLEETGKALRTAELELEQRDVLEEETAAHIHTLETQMKMLDRNLRNRDSGSGKRSKSAIIQTEPTELDPKLRSENTLLKTLVSNLSQSNEEQRTKIHSLETAKSSLEAQILSHSASSAQDSEALLVLRIQDILTLVSVCAAESRAILSEIRKGIVELGEIKTDMSHLRTSIDLDSGRISTLQEQVKSANIVASESPSPSQSDEFRTCKTALASTVVCISVLQTLISELTTGRATPNNAKIRALEAEAALLRKDKEMMFLEIKRLREEGNDGKLTDVGEEVLIKQAVFTLSAQITQTQDDLIRVLDRLETRSELVSPFLTACSQALPAAEELEQKLLKVLSELQSCIVASVQSNPANEVGAEQEKRIQQLKAQVDLMQTENFEYTAKMASERKSLKEQLYKIAESLEYRQDLWDQLQSIDTESGEDQSDKLTSLSEELERQSAWETKTLSLILTWFQDPGKPDISIIQEEAEEEESDETRKSFS